MKVLFGEFHFTRTRFSFADLFVPLFGTFLPLQNRISVSALPSSIRLASQGGIPRPTTSAGSPSKLPYSNFHRWSHISRFSTINSSCGLVPSLPLANANDQRAVPRSQLSVWSQPPTHRLFAFSGFSSELGHLAEYLHPNAASAWPLGVSSELNLVHVVPDFYGSLARRPSDRTSEPSS